MNLEKDNTLCNDIKKEEPQKRKVGRPRKLVDGKVVEKVVTPKLTLIEKQEIKLEKQKARDSEKLTRKRKEPTGAKKVKFYCTNKELQAELVKWRDSSDVVEDRILSEELGNMLLAVGNKLLNHTNFVKYSKELKEDMRSYGIYKIIRGLKNYNFKFNNPFAWVTQAFYNSYLSVLNKHYKHINTKKDILKKFISELEMINGISPNNSISKSIRNYLGDDYITNESNSEGE